MITRTPGQVVAQFCEEIHRGLRGEPVDAFRLLHPDIEFRHPDLGNMKGGAAASERIGKAILELWRIAPESGFYPLEFIEEGSQVAVVAMSHSEGNATGDPYNNIYFFLMTVENGRITSFHESLDSSITERIGFDRHLEGTVAR